MDLFAILLTTVAARSRAINRRALVVPNETRRHDFELIAKVNLPSAVTYAYFLQDYTITFVSLALIHALLRNSCHLFHVNTIFGYFLHSQGEEDSGAGGPGWEEVLTWLVEVGAEGESDAEGSEGESGRGTARLSWSTRLSAGPSTAATTDEPPHEHRVNTRLDIEKDDIQAVLPISKVGIS